MLNGLLDTLHSYIETGGFVMPPLIVATIILWYALGQRASMLSRGSKRNVRDLISLYGKKQSDRKTKGIIDTAVVRGLHIMKTKRHHYRKYLDDSFNEFHNQLTKHSVLIRSIVTIAPLAGLLGTVAGMIETFDSLGDMTLFSQSGGIAGGISQALFTTQMGLAIAIPGLIIERLLKRKQIRMQRELAQIKDILCSENSQTLNPQRT